MAKPILIVRFPEKGSAHFSDADIDRAKAEFKKEFTDYHVLLLFVDGVQVEIITEHNQPQGLSV
jgi:cobalamin biosynthesis Co2+ chelatase CbiK